MDTTVIVTRLRKLDGYLQSLRQLQAVTLDEYLDDDNLQAIVERRLQLAHIKEMRQCSTANLARMDPRCRSWGSGRGRWEAAWAS